MSIVKKIKSFLPYSEYKDFKNDDDVEEPDENNYSKNDNDSQNLEINNATPSLNELDGFSDSAGNPDDDIDFGTSNDVDFHNNQKRDVNIDSEDSHSEKQKSDINTKRYMEQERYRHIFQYEYLWNTNFLREEHIYSKGQHVDRDLSKRYVSLLKESHILQKNLLVFTKETHQNDIIFWRKVSTNDEFISGKSLPFIRDIIYQLGYHLLINTYKNFDFDPSHTTNNTIYTIFFCGYTEIEEYENDKSLHYNNNLLRKEPKVLLESVWTVISNIPNLKENIYNILFIDAEGSVWFPFRASQKIINIDCLGEVLNISDFNDIVVSEGAAERGVQNLNNYDNEEFTSQIRQFVTIFDNDIIDQKIDENGWMVLLPLFKEFIIHDGNLHNNPEKINAHFSFNFYMPPLTLSNDSYNSDSDEIYIEGNNETNPEKGKYYLSSYNINKDNKYDDEDIIEFTDTSSIEET
jgi:hypothetical protein